MGLLIERITRKPILEQMDKAQLPDAVLCRVTYPICNIGERNHNGRIYSREVWEVVANDADLMEKINSRCLFGHAEHPEGIQSNLEKTSHIVSKHWIQENAEGEYKKNTVYETMDVLDTPYGRIVDTILRAGCGLGVSTRAQGDLQEAEDDEGTYQDVIADSYKLQATDFTADPSTLRVKPMDLQLNVVGAVKRGVDEGKVDTDFAKHLLEQLDAPEAKSLKEAIENDKHHKDCKCKTSEKGCSGKCSRAKESNDQSGKMAGWIKSILSNDEASTDEELVQHFMKEGGLSEEEAKKWVSQRTEYLGGVAKEVKATESVVKASGDRGRGSYKVELLGKSEHQEEDEELFKAKIVKIISNPYGYELGDIVHVVKVGDKYEIDPFVGKQDEAKVSEVAVKEGVKNLDDEALKDYLPGLQVKIAKFGTDDDIWSDEDKALTKAELELVKAEMKDRGLTESKDNGPTDEDVSAKAWELYKQHWNALSSDEQAAVYKAMGVEEGQLQEKEAPECKKCGAKHWPFHGCNKKEDKPEEEETPVKEGVSVGDMVSIVKTSEYNDRKGKVEWVGDGKAKVVFTDDKSPKMNLFDLDQVQKQMGETKASCPDCTWSGNLAQVSRDGKDTAICPACKSSQVKLAEGYEKWQAMGDEEFMMAIAGASVSTLVQLTKVMDGDRLDSVQSAIDVIRDEAEGEIDMAGPEQDESKVKEGREVTVLIEPHMGKKGEILKHVPTHQSQDGDKYLVKVDGAEIYLTDTQFESKVKESKTRDEKDLETYKKRLASLGDAKTLGGERRKFQKIIADLEKKIGAATESKVNEDEGDLPFDRSGKMVGWIAMYKGKQVEILKDEAKDLWGAKQLAATRLKVPKSGMGLLAIAPAYDNVDESMFTERAHKVGEILEALNPEQLALIKELAEDVRPYVEKIEARPMTTKGHYGDYMGLLSQFKDKVTQLAMAMACKEAGANVEGVDWAMRMLTGKAFEGIVSEDGEATASVLNVGDEVELLVDIDGAKKGVTGYLAMVGDNSVVVSVGDPWSPRDDDFTFSVGKDKVKVIRAAKDMSFYKEEPTEAKVNEDATLPRFVYFGDNSGNVFGVSDADTIEEAWDEFKKITVRMEAGDASDAEYEKAEVTKDDGRWQVFVDGTIEGEWSVIDMQTEDPQVQSYIKELGIEKYAKEFVEERGVGEAHEHPEAHRGNRQLDFKATEAAAENMSDDELKGAMKDAIAAVKAGTDSGFYTDQVGVYRKVARARGIKFMESKEMHPGAICSKCGKDATEDEYSSGACDACGGDIIAEAVLEISAGVKDMIANHVYHKPYDTLVEAEKEMVDKVYFQVGADSVEESWLQGMDEAMDPLDVLVKQDDKDIGGYEYLGTYTGAKDIVDVYLDADDMYALYNEGGWIAFDNLGTVQDVIVALRDVAGDVVREAINLDLLEFEELSTAEIYRDALKMNDGNEREAAKSTLSLMTGGLADALESEAMEKAIDNFLSKVKAAPEEKVPSESVSAARSQEIKQRITEAHLRAEEEVLLEEVNRLEWRIGESLIEQFQLKTGLSSQFKVKLTEALAQAKAAKATLQEAHDKALQATTALWEKKLTAEIALVKAEAATEAIKAYIRGKLATSRLTVSERSLALLETCKTEEGVDVMFTQIRDAARQGLMHSVDLNEAEHLEVEVVEPEASEGPSLVGGFMERM